MCNYMDTKEAEKTVNNNKYLLDNIYSEYFLKNRNEIYIKEEIQILDSNDYIDDNYSTITKKNENKNKLIVNGLVCEHEKWTEKYPDYLKFNCENFGVNEDLIIKNALYDNCKTEHINSKIINNYQNTILSESVKKRRNKRNNKEKSILSKEGIKLQSKIVKKKIKTSEIDIENFNNEIYLTNGENLNNMPYVKNTNVEFTLDVKESTRDLSSKVEQVCIVKEEAILPDYYVVDTIENLKHNIISNEIALLKADYRGDDIQKNLDGKNKLIFSKRENLINYYKTI
ncbi:PREDICTED: MATH and LRR domain-containing protein PFE0570w-like [Ceratosolen solmsi marchali]|uniref:MATH and LRR domain-containing protein PFE0570w-like n=1 Tax=Ceratosolen solmsi marchali TaxID=326594 RepID=A0AAJ6YWN5_9HYME|nr:PREDICTED: MATH and LRR domain-containing protein PFE0570w-like [Ceratosolen solmsi marchali]